MSNFVDSCVVSNKFENFNSPEKEVLLELFETMPLMDNWIASIIESYIYAFVEDRYSDGYLKTRYRVKYGEKDGEYVYYYNNGNLGIKSNYINGKLEGEYYTYYEDGKLNIKSTFKDGEKHGYLFELDKSGKILKKEYYLKGHRIDMYIDGIC